MSETWSRKRKPSSPFPRASPGIPHKRHRTEKRRTQVGSRFGQVQNAQAKSSSKSSSNSNSKSNSGANVTPRKPFWQRWEESDGNIQRYHYNPTLCIVDRFVDATEDFEKSRSFTIEARQFFDRFRVYCGLPPSTQMVKKRNEEDDDDTDDDYDDDDDVYEPVEGYLDIQIDTPNVEKHEIESELPRVKEWDAKEEAMAQFLRDFPQRLRVFFTSYMRVEGLTWDDKFVDMASPVVGSYVKFLVRNRAFTEPDMVKVLEEALKVVELNGIELPLTSKISKAIPGKLGQAFTNCWGYRSPSYYPSETKTQNNHSTYARTQPPVPAEESGWGTEGANGAWNTSDTENVGASGWGEQTTASGWGDLKPQSLISFLGPLCIPLTHQTGIVEYSIRRIKQIIPPVTSNSKLLHATKPSASAVDDHLQSLLTQVILSPWPIICDPQLGNTIIPRIEVTPSTAGSRRPHDSRKDDIIVLVEAATGEMLRVGMALGGTYVQMAHQADFEEKGISKKKAKSPDFGFWYIEELTTTLTSFHSI